ncbi:MAG: hypothetical protein C0609_07665 [Deltaproteobacteria bacterium]|nr:MAG: hypothetical protein C0609_07665 [Deltaproteobacteria bacterium]
MRLSRREIMIITVGGVLLFVGIIWALIIDPVNSNLELLDKKIQYETERLSKVEDLSGRYIELVDRLAETEGKITADSNFSPLSHLETIASNFGIKNNITQMKPKPGENTRHYREAISEMKLDKIRLPMLVRFLHGVENPSGPNPALLRIKKLRIKPRFDDKELIDAQIEISSYQPPSRDSE